MAEFFLHKSSPTYLHPENADVMSISHFMAQNLRQAPPPIPPPPKHSFEISEGESVEIEKIVAAEKKDGQLYYKVKWVKYTWEAEESIQHLPHLIDGYWREHFYQNINQAAAIDTTGISLVTNDADFARNKTVVVNTHDNREVQKQVAAAAAAVNVVATPTDNQGVNGAITATASVGDNNDVMLEFTMGGQQAKGLEHAYQSRTPTNPADKKPRRTYPLERKYICQVCSKAFDRNTSLTRHMLVHTREKPFKCQLCEKAFSQNAHLKRHILIHIGQKSYQCNKCGKMFIEKGGLARHEATHSTEKPWVCNQCGKAFVLNEYLQRHLFLHTGQKPYQCNECGRLFADGSSWRAHKLTHNKEKKFKCHICSKMLKCKRNFKKHVAAHSEEKEMKHQCEICEERFHSKKQWKDHTRKSRKNHRCNVCRQLLKTREKYVTHMATHDPNSDTYNPEIQPPDPNDPDEKEDEEDMKSDDETKSDNESQDKGDDDDDGDDEDDDDDDGAVRADIREEGEVILEKILEDPNEEDAERSQTMSDVVTPTAFTAMILKQEHVNQMISEAPDEENQNDPASVLKSDQPLATPQVPSALELNENNVDISESLVNVTTPTVDVIGTSRDETLIDIHQVVVDDSASHIAVQPNPISASQTLNSQLVSQQITMPLPINAVQTVLENIQTSVALQNPVQQGSEMITSDPSTTAAADVAETIILITQNNDVDMPEQM